MLLILLLLAGRTFPLPSGAEPAPVSVIFQSEAPTEPEVLPLFYEWGSGSCYFRKDSLLLPTEYRRVSDFGYREIRKMLHSNLALPDDYRLTPEGTICPANYVNRKKVEEIFGSPARLMLYLSRNMKMEMSLSEGVLGTVPYADGELLGSVREICLREFGTSDAGTLGVEQRCRKHQIRRGLAQVEGPRRCHTDAGNVCRV